MPNKADSKTSNGRIWHVCKYCRRAYQRSDGLKAHKLQEHLQELLDIKRQKFNQLAAGTEAVRIHKVEANTKSEERNVQKLDECGLTVSKSTLTETTMSALICDLEKGSPGRRKRGQCWTCVNEPKVIRELCTHDLRTRRPFSCIHCGKSYIYANAFKKHSKIHSKITLTS